MLQHSSVFYTQRQSMRRKNMMLLSKRQRHKITISSTNQMHQSTYDTRPLNIYREMRKTTSRIILCVNFFSPCIKLDSVIFSKYSGAIMCFHYYTFIYVSYSVLPKLSKTFVPLTNCFHRLNIT